MNHKLILSAVLALAAASAQAAGPGTTGASFLKVGVGARELAMGSAASVLTEGAGAANWNPAKLAGLKGKHLSASYNMLFIDESQGYLGFASELKDDKGVIGGGLNYLTVGDIERRAGDTETPDSLFDSNNMALAFTYARAEVKPGLALGASLKYISQDLDTQTDKAVALDLGSTYKLNDIYTAAFVIQNLGGKVGPDNLPLLFKGGVARAFLDGKLAAAADVDWLAYDERFYLDLGAEYQLNKSLAFRAGYQVGRAQDELGGLTGLGAGLGLKFDRFSLDYAYVPFGDLGDTHRMTLGFNF
ncbi:MAG: PorV/PorQ family protein [Elusimicrobiales bacterium]|nr:PorV/PorQ family protein [Elusimicrobiales bacterium]